MVSPFFNRRAIFHPQPQWSAVLRGKRANCIPNNQPINRNECLINAHCGCLAEIGQWPGGCEAGVWECT